MSYRVEKINELLHKEVSKTLLKNVDFEGYIVTVTSVKTSPDFLNTDILITVMPDSKEKEALMEIDKNIYDIQKIINKKLNIKNVPKLSFKIDEGTKNLYKIDRGSTNL